MKLSKNARRKLKRYRMAELLRQQAIDEQLQTVPFEPTKKRRRPEIIMTSMCDKIGKPAKRKRRRRKIRVLK